MCVKMHRNVRRREQGVRAHMGGSLNISRIRMVRTLCGTREQVETGPPQFKVAPIY